MINYRICYNSDILPSNNYISIVNFQVVEKSGLGFHTLGNYNGYDLFTILIIGLKVYLKYLYLSTFT